MAVLYRPAEPSDIPLLVKARLDFLQILGQAAPESDMAFAQKQIETFLAAHLGTRIFAWLAFVDEELASAGFLQVYEVMYHPHAHIGQFGRIINMLTWPDYRKQGLARGIIERLIAQARALGLAYINLDASPDGRHLYETLGFAEQHPIHPPMTLDF